MKPGSVPTARIAPILGELIRERWPHGGGCGVLAEKVGCDASTVEGVVAQDYPGVPFDLADALLVGLGRWDIWHGVLADIYPTTFMERCAAPGCNKQFPEYHRGGKPKRTCSPRCKSRLESVKLGRVKSPGARVMGRCNRGHRLTPENTKISKDTGFRRCRTCARERDREHARLRRAERRAAA